MADQSINRIDFIRRMVDAGLTFEQSHAAFDAVTQTLEEGIVNRKKINFGRILTVYPVELPPRKVSTNFKQANGNRKVYYLGRRVRYRVRLFRQFLSSRSLQWFE